MSLSTRNALFAEPSHSSKVEWEEVDCPLCGGGQYRGLIEAPDTTRAEGRRFLVVQCQQCTLCFTNPRPTQRSIGQFYHEDYKPHHRQANPNSTTKPWWKRFWRRRERLRDALPLHGQGRLLDFGCGEGSFLLRMQRQGWQATGVDNSLAAMECLRIAGLNAVRGSLPHPDLPPESFDMVTMWQSLEHVHQPLDVLRAARGLLVPGGKILVACPNIESMPFHWFGPAWNALDLPRHLTHFSPATLQTIMIRAGFRTGSVRMVRGSSWLRQSAHRARRMAVTPSRWLSWMRTRLGSNLASWYCYLTRLSDSIMIMGVK